MARTIATAAEHLWCGEVTVDLLIRSDHSEVGGEEEEEVWV